MQGHTRWLGGKRFMNPVINWLGFRGIPLKSAYLLFCLLLVARLTKQLGGKMSVTSYWDV